MDTLLKILIVEDDLISAEYLKNILELAGYEVIDICTKGQEAIDVAIDKKPDLILMDIMLKDNITGCDAAKYLLNIIDTKVIFISAYADPEIVDCAVEAHGYDYIVKPYQDIQILTTIKMAMHQNSYKESSLSIIKLADNYSYDPSKKELCYFDNVIKLKQNKIDFIDLLAKNIDRVVSYEEIYEHIFDGKESNSALRTFVSRLNKKLGTTLIESVSSMGYKLKKAKNSI